MARRIASKLTRDMLEEWGFTKVDYLADYPAIAKRVRGEDNDYAEWWIDRYWYVGGGRKKEHKRVKVTCAVCKHKYGATQYYPKVTFSADGKSYSISLSRFLYAWFYGEVEEGMVVDHIDNNTFNNSLNNLQVLTYEENLAKRFTDDPSNAHNQYELINRSKEALND